MQRNRIRILLFLGSFEVENTVAEWVPYLARFPVSFALAPIVKHEEIETFEESLREFQRESGLHPYPVIVKMPNTQLRNALNLRSLAKDLHSIYKVFALSRPDVVVCFFIKHAYPLVILKKLLGFRLCVYAMGDDINLGKSIVEILLRKLVYVSSDKIFAVSEDLKLKIQKVHKCDVDVIPLGTDPDFFRPLQNKSALRRKWGYSRKDFVILTVCRLDKRKGVDLLIKSVAKLKNDNARLLVAGLGEEAVPLKSLARSLQVPTKVSFLGFRTKSELRELYNLADLFALASYSEGLPRALIEAMSCGCVCIATRVGDTAKVVEDHYNGFLVSPGSSDEIYARIVHYSSLSDEEREKLRRNTRPVILRRFNSQKLVEEMMERILLNARA